MKAFLIVVGVLVVGGIAWYGLSPLFHPIKTSEPVPTNTTMMEHKDAVSTSTMEDTSSHTMMLQELSGEVKGTPAHPASGTVKIVEADGKSYVRYKNLKTINGPDIYVYLSKDLGAKDYVSLGKVKSTEGDSNYEIPMGVDPAAYPYVLIWCKQFGVLFNSAQLHR